jgi:biopolymer transport protein TolR
MPKVHHVDASGSGRRGRGARVATSLAEINVVPLVDVMLVLLIIFMVTAPMMQQGLAVNLPQVRKADPISAPVTVTVPADFRNTRVVQLGDKEVRVDILHERVRQEILARDDKSVVIRADAATSMQDLMDVAEKLKEAGVEKVGLTSQPRELKR